MNYKSQKELYLALIPAINVKIRELRLKEKVSVDKEEIWNYLRDNKWRLCVDLTLNDMVDDIIKLDNLEFLKSKKVDI